MADPVELLYAELAAQPAPPGPAPALTPTPIPPALVIDLAAVASEGTPADPIAADASTTAKPLPQAPSAANRRPDDTRPTPDLTQDPQAPRTTTTATATDAPTATATTTAADASTTTDAPTVDTADPDTADPTATAGASTFAPRRAASTPRTGTELPPLRLADTPAPPRGPADTPRRTPVARPRARARESAALPPGAILLGEPEHIPRPRLLRHVTAVLQSRPLTPQTFARGNRPVVLDEPAITEPGARAILDRFGEAVAGVSRRDGRALPGQRRLDLLRTARDQLDDYLGPLRLDVPDDLAAHEPYQAALLAQQDTLAGVAAADDLRAGIPRGDAREGLAAPTLAARDLTSQLDLVLLVIDDLSKTVTATTRVQAREIGSAADNFLADKAVGVAGRRLGFLGAMIYLRALLNTAKALISGGYIAGPNYSASEKAIMIANLPTKLAEGIYSTGALISATATFVAGNQSDAAAILARYVTLGRNLVWAGAGIQLFSGLLNLVLVAVTDQKFRRTYLTDVLWGGAGSLAPVGAAAQALANRALVREVGVGAAELVVQRKLLESVVERGLLAGAEETAARAAITQLGKQLGAYVTASGVRAAAGPLSYYLLLLDAPIQLGTFAVADNDRLNVRGSLRTTFLGLEYLAGGVSQHAVDLVDVLENRHLAPLFAVSRAGQLFDYLKNGLDSYARTHETTQKTGTRLPLLAVRLRGVLAELDGVTRTDPRSVLAGVRRVFARLRELFTDEDKLYRDELRRIDHESLFELHTAITDPPP
mgnify:CR=1 FL=1